MRRSINPFKREYNSAYFTIQLDLKAAEFVILFIELFDVKIVDPTILQLFSERG